MLDTELKRERKSVGGLPSQRVKCHLIKRLMNELRAKIFGGALKRRPCPRGGGGVWRTPGPGNLPHHIDGGIKSVECSQRFDLQPFLNYTYCFSPAPPLTLNVVFID